MTRRSVKLEDGGTALIEDTEVNYVRVATSTSERVIDGDDEWQELHTAQRKHVNLKNNKAGDIERGNIRNTRRPD